MTSKHGDQALDALVKYVGDILDTLVPFAPNVLNPERLNRTRMAVRGLGITLGMAVKADTLEDVDAMFAARMKAIREYELARHDPTTVDVDRWPDKGDEHENDSLDTDARREGQDGQGTAEGLAEAPGQRAQRGDTT